MSGFAFAAFKCQSILLLRHDGRAPCNRIVDFDITVFRRGPHVEVVSEAGKRAGSNRHRADDLKAVISACRAVDGVLHGFVKTEQGTCSVSIDHESGRTHGTAPKRANVQGLPSILDSFVITL